MGRIHSIQTMGLVDGPGIRSVVFFQGCLLRCVYCHNPDTWELRGGEEIGAKELAEKLIRFKSYYDKSGGGITCSGGEPLAQPRFLKEFLQLCKSKGIHTAIDTSGVGLGDYEEILKSTDLVLLDIKHPDALGFKELTGGNMQKLEEFIAALRTSECDVWVRHVVMPGRTDSEAHLSQLREYVAAHVPRVKKIELLKYHTLGEYKYEALHLRRT